MLDSELLHNFDLILLFSKYYFILHLDLRLPLLKQRILFSIFESIHGKKVVVNLLVNILLYSPPTERHHIFGLVFAQVKVHIKRSNQVID